MRIYLSLSRKLMLDHGCGEPMLESLKRLISDLRIVFIVSAAMSSISILIAYLLDL